MENPGLKKHSGRPVVIMRRRAFEDNSPSGMHGGPLASSDDPQLDGVVPLYQTDHTDVETAPPLNSGMPHPDPISAENGDDGAGPLSLRQSAIAPMMVNTRPAINEAAIPHLAPQLAKGVVPTKPARDAAQQQADQARRAEQSYIEQVRGPGMGSSPVNQTHTEAEQQIGEHARMEGRTTASYSAKVEMKLAHPLHQAYHDVRDDLGRFAPKGTRRSDELSVKPGHFQQAEREMGTTKALAWDRLRRAHPHVEIGPDESYENHYKRLRAERRKQKDPKRPHNKIKRHMATNPGLARFAGQRYEYGSCPVCDAEIDDVCTSTKPGANYGKPISRPHPERERKPVSKQGASEWDPELGDYWNDDPHYRYSDDEENDSPYGGPPRNDHRHLTGPGSIGLKYTPAGPYGEYYTVNPGGNIYHHVKWDPNEGEYTVASADKSSKDYDNLQWVRSRAQDPSEVAGAIRRHEIQLRGGGEHGEAGGRGWWNPDARTMDMVADTTPLERALGPGKAERAVYGGLMWHEAADLTPGQLAAQQWLDENPEGFTTWTGHGSDAAGEHFGEGGEQISPEQEQEIHSALLNQAGFRHVDGGPRQLDFWFRNSQNEPTTGHRIMEPTPWTPYWSVYHGPSRSYGMNHFPIGMHESLENAIDTANNHESRLGEA